jgi:tetratricopeptide (TPR) repeat protein
MKQVKYFIILLFLPFVVFGQDMREEEGMKYLDLGINQMEAGDYEHADQSFRTVLESVKVLPSEICYYFGLNSYHLGRYKQSINWLNKYIELKGTSGQFFDETSEYLKKAEEAYNTEQKANEKDATTDESAPEIKVDYENLPDVDCNPAGKVICPVCKGITVIIHKDKFGRHIYQSCPYCDDHGYLTCEEYRLLLKGELKPKGDRIPYDFSDKE